MCQEILLFDFEVFVLNSCLIRFDSENGETFFFRSKEASICRGIRKEEPREYVRRLIEAN